MLVYLKLIKKMHHWHCLHPRPNPYNLSKPSYISTFIGMFTVRSRSVSVATVNDADDDKADNYNDAFNPIVKSGFGKQLYWLTYRELTNIRR